MDRIIFHHNGKEYQVYEPLTVDEVKTIIVMQQERNKKLDGLNKKSAKKYFEDSDKLVVTILRKCFHLSDDQIIDIDEAERRNLAYSFVRFLIAANDLSTDRK